MSIPTPIAMELADGTTWKLGDRVAHPGGTGTISQLRSTDVTVSAPDPTGRTRLRFGTDVAYGDLKRIATAQQERSIGRMIRADVAWHAATYEWHGSNLVIETANGARATVALDGTVKYSIVLHTTDNA